MTHLSIWKFIRAFLSLWAAALFLWLAPAMLANECVVTPKPVAKVPFFKDRAVIALWAANATVDAWDMKRTRWGMSRGYIELNPLLRPLVHNTFVYPEQQIEMLGLAYIAHRMRTNTRQNCIGRIARKTWWIPQVVQLEQNAHGVSTWWGLKRNWNVRP